eukprot:GHVH01006087.1.p1 GENE.GHVH01006087.1~~GHVH01006087.1.p1  ORF type:complete len:443 (-),score=48.30 GHVH01006087.1:138-1466(-)
MQSFQEESFWFLRPELPTTSSIPNSVRFLWNRRRLFDLNAVNGYKQIADTFLGNASITSLDQHPKRRWRPMPLTTVAMTTIAARKLRIASAETMRIAERLYQQGYVSYPRTETDSYPSSLPLLDILTTLSSHSSLGVFASSVIDSRNNNRGLGQPLNVRAASTVRSGSQSDEAHPPIHPVKNLEVSQALSIDPNAYRIYELIARHFIATLTEDAIGAETVATLGIGPESFSCTGLMILEKNFLEVYAPYESWSAKQIPTFHQNQQIAVQSISVVEGKTSRPEPYEEADLIGLMDRHGIGTDATMHDHIHTIQERQYVKMTTMTSGMARVVTSEEDLEENLENTDNRARQRFVPTPLGIALIESFRRLGDGSAGLDLSRISLRAEMERDFTRIAAGDLEASPALNRHLLRVKAIFDSMFTRRHQMAQYVVSMFRQYNNQIATS